MRTRDRVTWPEGRKFAFTIFDDTDWASVENLSPVYALLDSLGMRTTKSVWMVQGDAKPKIGGTTMEEPSYRRWVNLLRSRGFEIGLHGAAPGTSSRAQTAAAFESFTREFGERRVVHCNHTGCLDNIYWGPHRLSGLRRSAYRWATHDRNGSWGHVRESEYFWGDICEDRVSYVRNFVTEQLDTLAFCPAMPYHDPERPFVRFWFASADGGNVQRFLKNFTVDALQRLEESQGLSIAYVHFGAGFAPGGRLHPEFVKRMEYLASLRPWVAPVTDVLDYLRQDAAPQDRTIGLRARASLERRWLSARAKKWVDDRFHPLPSSGRRGVE